MTMKKKLAIILCSMPFAIAPVAYAQTGGTTEGTTSPQSGNQTDMGEDGAPNTGGSSGSNASSTGSSASDTGSAGSASTPSSSAGSNASSSGAAATPDASAGESFKAKLQGKSVYNENDEKVGDIKDLVMSSDNKVTHVILGVGGFVGVGEHPVAIPINEIKESGDKLTLQGYTKDQLKEMPAYEYPKEAPAPAPAASPTAPMGATR